MANIISELKAKFAHYYGSFKPMEVQNLLIIEASSEQSLLHDDPLMRELGQLDRVGDIVGSPFKNWEQQMFGENIPPLQQKITFGMFEPPKISGVGDMFFQSMSAAQLRYMRTLAHYGNQNSFLFSFMNRVSNLFQAAKNAVGLGNTLFWVPQTSSNQPAGGNKGGGNY